MILKINRLILSLLILSILAGSGAARAFGFTDISSSETGTKMQPVQANSEVDVLCKYMRQNGMGLGRLYYTSRDGGVFDQRVLVNMTRLIYPFLMSATSWYEYADKYESGKVYYIELFFYTPEYVEPAVKKAAEIAAKLVTPDMGYMEKLRAFHDYLVDNVEYDWELYNSATPDMKSPGYTAYGALINGRAVCEGYSSAFALMCHAAGIPAYLITGENRQGAHSWNIVYLYGEFFHVDVTGDDTSGDRHRYFMRAEDEIIKTHTVDSKENRAAIRSLHNVELPSAQLLHELGLFQGVGDGFGLDGSTSRLDAAVMLTRMLGREEDVKRKQYTHPFTDVPEWASTYIGYLYSRGLVAGTTKTRFEGAQPISTNGYLTFMLRALGYSDSKGDFTYDTAVATAERLGLTPMGRYKSGVAVTRGDMAAISVRALLTGTTGGAYLLDNLTGDGVVSRARADGVAGYLPVR